MICPPLLQTCQIATSLTDKFGDQTISGTQTYSCRFRDINQLQQNTNSESYQCSAMIWLAPDVPVEEGTLIIFDFKTYRVQEITKARRFSEEILFLKCSLQLFTSEDDGGS